MANDSSEKQHLPSAKRLDELRKKGSVMRSRDLSAGLIFMVAIFLLIFMVSSFKSQLQNNFIWAYHSIKDMPGNQDFLLTLLRTILVKNFFLLMPMFAILFIATLLTPFLFGGWNFTLEAIQFNWDKLNPATNLKRIFSPATALMEIGRSMLKCGLLMGALVYFVLHRQNEISQLINFSTKSAIGASYVIIEDFIILLSVTLIFLIAFDVYYHYVKFQNQSKMSSQELKDEYKDTEGSGEVKRKIRSAQYAMYKQRLSQMVPKANVIITNPTHYAISLQYDDKKDRAPKVTAKGKDYVAQQIRYLAIANGVPIYEAPLLARAIYHTTKIGLEINPGLYMAVAIVLSYVQQLKNYQYGKGKPPTYVSDLEIPPEFIYNE
ncbi:MAG: flagellar type III secretion system protein FlhB [Gammaproteobacteria bacterium]